MERTINLIVISQFWSDASSEIRQEATQLLYVGQNNRLLFLFTTLLCVCHCRNWLVKKITKIISCFSKNRHLLYNSVEEIDKIQYLAQSLTCGHNFTFYCVLLFIIIPCITKNKLIELKLTLYHTINSNNKTTWVKD